MNEQKNEQPPAAVPAETLPAFPIPAPGSMGKTEKILICVGFVAVELLDKWLPVWAREGSKEILRILSRRAGI